LFICAIYSTLKILSGAAAFNDFLNGLLDLIPVISIDSRHLHVEILLNLVELSPALLVVDEADAHTHAAKPACTSDTVKISLWVASALLVFWHVLVVHSLVGFR
jgi:hypothetical protein